MERRTQEPETFEKLLDREKRLNYEIGTAYLQSKTGETVSQKELESIYIRALNVIETIQELLEQTHSFDERNSKSRSENSASDVPEIDVEFEKNGIVRCQLFTPPILKSKAAAWKFYDVFSLKISEKVASAVPRNFEKYDASYVIYVNHYADSPSGKQPYFDNDNLAIKSILDAIVPYVCIDDSIRYCDNLYISQPDRANFAEIFVVEKKKFADWIEAHQTLQFCKNIKKNAERFSN